MPTKEDSHIEKLFFFLDRAERAQLIPYLEARSWQADELLMDSGQSADWLGFLLKGRVAVKRQTDFPGKYTLLALLDPGSMVGELSVVVPGPCRSRLLALEESHLLLLPKAKLDIILREHPELGVKLLRQIIVILGNRLRKAGDRLAFLL